MAKRQLQRCRRQVGGMSQPLGAPPKDDRAAICSPPGNVPVILEVSTLQLDIAALMRQVRIPEVLIFAYLRTGLLVTDDNWANLGPDDQGAWKRAIDEYYYLESQTAL